MPIGAFTLSQNLVVLSGGLYMAWSRIALMRIQTTSGRWFTQTGLIIALARLHRLASFLLRIPMRIMCSV